MIYSEAANRGGDVPASEVNNTGWFARIRPAAVEVRAGKTVDVSIRKPDLDGHRATPVFGGIEFDDGRPRKCGTLTNRLIKLEWGFEGEAGNPTVIEAGREITDFGDRHCTRSSGFSRCTGPMKFRFGAPTGLDARFVVTAYWETEVRPYESTGEPDETFLSEKVAYIDLDTVPECDPAPPRSAVPAVADRLRWATNLALNPDYEPPPGSTPLPEVPGGDEYLIVRGSEVWPVLSGNLNVIEEGSGCAWTATDVVSELRERVPWSATDAAVLADRFPVVETRWKELPPGRRAEIRAAHVPGDLVSVCPITADMSGCRWRLAKQGVWSWWLRVRYANAAGETGDLTVSSGTTWFLQLIDYADVALRSTDGR